MPICSKLPIIFLFFFLLELTYIRRISKDNVAKKKLFNQLNVCRQSLPAQHGIKLNERCILDKKRSESNLGSWAVVQKRKCQIHIQRWRLGHSSWNTWFMFKRKWQHASSASYQLRSPCGHSLPAKRSARFLKWTFYAHYIYFLSTYFPLPPCDSLSVSNNAPSLYL